MTNVQKHYTEWGKPEHFLENLRDKWAHSILLQDPAPHDDQRLTQSSKTSKIYKNEKNWKNDVKLYLQVAAFHT